MVGLLTPWEMVDSRVKRRSGSLIFVFRCPHVCVKVQRLPLLLQTNGDNQNFGSGPHGVPSLDSGKSIPVWEPPRNCSKRRDDPPHPPKKEKLWKSNQTFYVKKGFKKWRTSSFYSVDLIQSAVCLSVCSARTTLGCGASVRHSRNTRSHTPTHARRGVECGNVIFPRRAVSLAFEI